jgi:ribosomal protein S18 acetylase RimI-like enzyme
MTRHFSDGDLDSAAAFLAERHARQRKAEPLLPAEVDFRAEVEALWRQPGASGAVSEYGFLIGTPREDPVWGPNVWVELAGHAVEEAEAARDLYALAATRWVDEGNTRHYVIVPATDAALVDAWFRLGFGQQHAFGIREVPPEVEWPEGVHPATETDVDALVALAPLLRDHQAGSPVFGAGRPLESEEELRKDILESVASDESVDLVAETDGRVVGVFYVTPLEQSTLHVGLARRQGAAFLAWAATLPELRGSGAGLRLTQASLAWARSRGHDVIVTDWRVTNLLASRFWPARGFRPTFLRLYRHIP